MLKPRVLIRVVAVGDIDVPVYVDASANPDDSLLQLVADAATRSAQAAQALGLPQSDFGVFQVGGKLFVRVAPAGRWGDFEHGIHLPFNSLISHERNPDGPNGLRSILARYALVHTFAGFFDFDVTAAELDERASILNHLLSARADTLDDVGSVEP